MILQLSVKIKIGAIHSKDILSSIHQGFNVLLIWCLVRTKDCQIHRFHRTVYQYRENRIGTARVGACGNTRPAFGFGGHKQRVEYAAYSVNYSMEVNTRNLHQGLKTFTILFKVIARLEKTTRVTLG